MKGLIAACCVLVCLMGDPITTAQESFNLLTNNQPAYGKPDLQLGNTAVEFP